MTPEETVRAIAIQEGVNPDLAVSLWQQESGKSTDTSLRGQALSKGRGAAVGPFQVVPYYHPEFPQQGPFEDQARYALKYLKKVGPAGYYGTGQAPAGQPTTNQYVSQVMSRVPQDVRMAGDTDNLGMPVPSGDPQTGRMTLPPVISQMPPGMDSTGQSIEEAMRQTTQKAQPDLWSDPLLHIGLALLSQKKVGGGPLRNVARGVQAGMASYSQAQASQAKAQQDAVSQKLYAARTNMEYARMMGGGAMDPYQQQQGVGTPQQFWDPTTKQVKSVFFDRGQRAWFDANTQQRASIEGLIPYSEEAAGIGGKGASKSDAVQAWIVTDQKGEKRTEFASPLEARQIQAPGEIWSKPGTDSSSGGKSAATQQAKVDSALTYLDNMERLALGEWDEKAQKRTTKGAFTGIESGTSGLGRIAGGLGNLPSRLGQTEGSQGALMETYSRERKAFASALARLNDSGVLSNQDVTRILGATPDPAYFMPDSEAQAAALFNEARLNFKQVLAEKGANKSLPPSLSGAVPAVSGGATTPEQMSDEELLEAVRQERARRAGGAK